MLTFKSFECLSRLGPHDPARPVIHELLDSFIPPTDEHGHSYDPDNDGYIVLIDRADADRELNLFTPPRKLEDVFWEGVHVSGDYFVAVFIPNNSFSLACVIENSDSLSPGLRRVLCANLVPNAT
jgi:hypothetical protein